MAHEITIDDKENRIFPHPEVSAAYLDEKKGNGYVRQRVAEDDIYEGWYNACRKNPFHCTAKTIIRTRAVVKGKLQEILLAYCSITGSSRQGDTIGQDLEYFYWQGLYDEPLFERKLNQRTDILEVIGVRDHVRKYNMPYNQANMKSLIEEADDSTIFMVKEGPEMAQGWEIRDTEGFQEANFAQLIEMGRSKRSLEEVRDLASALGKLKASPIVDEQKNEAKTQADIAENMGEHESAEELKDIAKINESEKLDLADDDDVKVSTETVTKKHHKKGK